MKLVAIPNDKIKTLGNAGNGHHSKDVFDPQGIMPTLTTGNHGNGQLVGESDRGGVKDNGSD